MTIETIDYSVKTVESVKDLDRPKLYDLIYLTQYLPPSSELHGSAYTDIEAELTEFVGDEAAPSAILIAEKAPLGRAVGFAEVHIAADGAGRVAEVTRLALVPDEQNAKAVGTLLLDQVAAWSAEHEASGMSAKDVEFTGRIIGQKVLSLTPDDIERHYSGQYLG